MLKSCVSFKDTQKSTKLQLTEEMKFYEEGFEIRKLSNRKACESISAHTSRLHTNIKVDMETIFIQFFLFVQSKLMQFIYIQNYIMSNKTTAKMSLKLKIAYKVL